MSRQKEPSPKRSDARARLASERLIRDKIVKLIKARGWMVRVRSATAHSHVVGDPDLYGCAMGVHFEIEVKIPGRYPTQVQEARLKEWRAHGAICLWGSDPDAVVRQLQMEVDDLCQRSR